MIRRAAAGGVIDCAARESNQESKAISDYFSAISEQLNEEVRPVNGCKLQPCGCGNVATQLL